MLAACSSWMMTRFSSLDCIAPDDQLAEPLMSVSLYLPSAPLVPSTAYLLWFAPYLPLRSLSNTETTLLSRLSSSSRSSSREILQVRPSPCSTFTFCEPRPYVKPSLDSA